MAAAIEGEEDFQAPTRSSYFSAPQQPTEAPAAEPADAGKQPTRHQSAAASTESAPVAERVIASDAAPVVQTPAHAAPVAARPAPAAPLASSPPPAPVSSAPFALPTSELHAVAEASGLQWVNSDPAKVAQAQAAIAAEPAPAHVPRQPKAAPVLDNGPLVLVETRKDLSKLPVPF